MHLGIVTETYPPEVNGVAMTLQRVTEALCRRGHSVHLVRPRQGRTDRGGAGSADTLKSTLVPSLSLPGYRDLRFGLPAGRRLNRIWRHRRPDVLYVATEGPLGWSAIRLAARLGIPAVSGFHTNFHQYGRYYGAGPLRRWIFSYLRYLHNQAHCTLVPTEALRRELLAKRFERVAVLGRGVDATLFNPGRRSAELRRHWGLGEGDKAVLYVGRLAPEKNVELVLQAFRLMRVRRPGLRLVLVGDGPVASRLGHLGEDVVLCGSRRGIDLATHYASCDYFLFPSETETFGNVTQEAMASGLAVLAYDYAAAAELIDHGHNGLLAEPGDSGDFVARALDLLALGGHEEQLRAGARRTALTHSWQGVVERFESIMSASAEGGYDYCSDPSLA